MRHLTSNKVRDASSPVRRYRLAWAVAAWLGLVLGACGSNPSVDNGVTPVQDASPPAEDAPPPATPCRPPVGVSGSPGDVAALVAFVNALGAERSFPLEITCVVEALDRPLAILASRSPFSLQPAFNVQNPRFFLWSGPLVMTVVPVGDGRKLLELGQQVSETRSIKAEITFPLASPLSAEQPFDHLLHEGLTSCASCHGGEMPAAQVGSTTAFVSDVFRPLKAQEVDLEFLRGQFATCDPRQEPDRCAMFSAIFAHGELTPRAFSDMAKTIYDN